MIVGIMEMEFKIFDSFSLKDKRRVMKSIADKTKRIFNVSIAEVDNNEVLNYATLGYACVSNSKKVVESVFDKILNFYTVNFDIEIISVRKDFL